MRRGDTIRAAGLELAKAAHSKLTTVPECRYVVNKQCFSFFILMLFYFNSSNILLHLKMQGMVLFLKMEIANYEILLNDSF